MLRPGTYSNLDSINVVYKLPNPSCIAGEELDDYPDLPERQAAISREAANSILDSEDPPYALDTSDGEGSPGNRPKRRLEDTRNSRNEEPFSVGPALLPIY
jgi:hypothetical protein